MRTKLEEFLELEKKATKGPWETDRPICHSGVMAVRENGALIDWICSMQVSNQPNYANDAQFIAQSRTIAPLAVNKLMEAVELLEKASGLLSSELGCTRQLHKRINEFLEDFNDEN